MNLREIDRLIAEKVMGWEPVYDDGDLISFVTEFGTLFFSDDDESEWSPTIDIADAWKVVEKIIEQFGSYSLTKIKDGGHYCEVLYWNHGAFDVIAEAEAKTAELAICLAALKSVGVEVEVNE